MKIIRWLLSHIFLILLIIVVIYGYMFWGNLLGEDTPAGKAIAYLSEEFPVVEEFVVAVKEKQAKLSGSEDAPSASSESTPAAPVISYSYNQTQVTQDAQGVVETSEPATAGAGAPPAVQASARQAPADMATGSSRSSAAMPTDARSMQVQPAQPQMQPQAEEQFVPAEIEKQLDNVDEQGKVIDPALASQEVRKNWVTARKSFYQRNYEQSEKSYQQVIDSTEDNFDAYGELGNVYFNQGKNKQAASAYYEAAAILVKKGQVNRARSLMGLLRHLDRTKADELQKLIDSSAS
jgi:tetratricopeptide (TPR) repeat protein